MPGKERRSAQRINDEELSLKIRAGGFDTSTHTLNISSSGLYCKVDKEIPLMSRVKLMLMLSKQPKADKNAKGIEVEGVVVRMHPVIVDSRIKHYDLAIFFDNLDPKARTDIANYIARKKAA